MMSMVSVMRLDQRPEAPATAAMRDDYADAVLVQRAGAGDAAAFEALVRRYQHKVHGYLVRMTNGAEEAEDLTQEVFIKAFVSLGSFRGEASVQTWLYRIATNLCIDRSRRHRRQVPTAYSLDEPTEEQPEGGGREIPDHDADPYRAIARQELRTRVRQGLAALPEKLRAVVVLYDLQGLSYEEIAEALNCPLGTVKSRLFNARLELARKLKSYVQS